MVEKKFFAIDLDGTLLTWNKKLTKRNLEALLKIQAEGHKIAFLTGRDIVNVTSFAKKAKLDTYGGYIGAYNGGLVYSCKEDQIIKESFFDPDLVLEIKEYLEKLNLDFTFLRPREQYISKKAYLPFSLYRKLNGKKTYPIDELFTKNLHVNKILVNDTKSKLLKVWAKLENKFSGKISISMSSIISIELTPAGSDKGAALEYLASLENIDMSNTIAIGNQGNDLPMLKKAGKAIVVNNASKNIKDQADLIIPSNNKKGVGIYLERFLEDEWKN